MQGTHMILSGDAGQALIFYKLHLNDQPPQLDYFRTVIDMEIFFKRPDSVDLYVKRALRLFPNETDLYVSRAHAQVYAGNCRRGVRDYTRALKYARTDSMRSQIWGFIGDAWHQLGEESQGGSAQARCRRKCFEAYDRALGYNYDNASVLNNYAYFTCEQTDDPKRLDQGLCHGGPCGRAGREQLDHARHLRLGALQAGTSAGGAARDAAGHLVRQQR